MMKKIYPASDCLFCKAACQWSSKSWDRTRNWS